MDTSLRHVRHSGMGGHIDRQRSFHGIVPRVVDGDGRRFCPLGL